MRRDGLFSVIPMLKLIIRNKEYMKRIFKRNVYLLLGLTALCSGIIGCDDRMDDPVSGQELVTVPLSFGFAEESISELYRNGSR